MAGFEGTTQQSAKCTPMLEHSNSGESGFSAASVLGANGNRRQGFAGPESLRNLWEGIVFHAHQSSMRAGGRSSWTACERVSAVFTIEREDFHEGYEQVLWPVGRSVVGIETGGRMGRACR